MTAARWWLGAVFGPHEIPRWPFLPIITPALIAVAYLKLRRAP